VTPSEDAVGDLRRAADLLREARNVLVLTGAGVSAESGVPTFRGPDGLWRKHRPEDLATPGAFRRDPRLVWEWYAWRQERVSACEPNAGHHAIALLVRERGARLVTQNVDGLHDRAARAAAGGAPQSPRETSLELHGSLFRVKCTHCKWRGTLSAPVDATSEETLPHCERCGSLLRPAVVWFGEPLDPTVLAAAFRLAESAELCLVVGTSALVHPAASLPFATLDSGGELVEVNPAPTPLSSACSISLAGAAGVILPRLVAVL
jgi:NAD-dependent deacetylase